MSGPVASLGLLHDKNKTSLSHKAKDKLVLGHFNNKEDKENNNMDTAEVENKDVKLINKFDNIEDEKDETLLKSWLDETTDFEIRRRIRSRLRQLRKAEEPLKQEKITPSRQNNLNSTPSGQRFCPTKSRDDSDFKRNTKHLIDENYNRSPNIEIPKVDLKPAVIQQSRPITSQNVTEKVDLKPASNKTCSKSELEGKCELPSVNLRTVPKLSEKNVSEGKKFGVNTFSVPLRKVVNEDKSTTPVKSSKERTRQTPQSARARFKELDSIAFEQSDGTTKRITVNSIKDQMLAWCQARLSYYENVNVVDFSSSWNNGLAFCALVHSYFPNAFDYDSLEASNRRHNFELAFTSAEKLADVCPLLDVDDMMCTLNPDWKCVFTYVNTLANELREAAKKQRGYD